MKQRHLNALLLALAGSLLAPAAAQAHEIWLARIHGQPTVMYGHEESDTDPYDPITISEARAYKNGKPEEVAIVRHYTQRFATLKAEAPGLLTFTKEGGIWSKTKDGKWHNLAKDQLPNPADAERSMHARGFSAAYLNKREPVTKLGYELEIVPETNPAKLLPGEKLPVQVLYRGQPLADAKVTSNAFDHEAQKATTDAQGRATLTVARSGLNVISVNHAVAYPDPKKADKDITLFTLTFEAAGGGHNH